MSGLHAPPARRLDLAPTRVPVIPSRHPALTGAFDDRSAPWPVVFYVLRADARGRSAPWPVVFYVLRADARGRSAPWPVVFYVLRADARGRSAPWPVAF